MKNSLYRMAPALMAGSLTMVGVAISSPAQAATLAPWNFVIDNPSQSIGAAQTDQVGFPGIALYTGRIFNGSTTENLEVNYSFLPPDSPLSLASTGGSLSIKPRQTEAFSFNIKYPESTKIGTYSGTVVVESINGVFPVLSDDYSFKVEQRFAMNEVPEPLTILGSGMALGFGVLMERQYSRKRKKTKQIG